MVGDVLQRLDCIFVQGGWGIWLDSKGLRTPAKNPLRLPNYPLALAVAAEWQWQVPVSCLLHALKSKFQGVLVARGGVVLVVSTADSLLQYGVS